MEDFVMTIPLSDRVFAEALAARMGWKMRERKSSLNNFISSCKKDVEMTDEEIMAEVNAVRYAV